MNIDTLTKIKMILLKAITGFLCAFFPLYIAQYLSHHLFMFPMDMIIGIIILIPFFFLAKFLWRTINAYYLLAIFERAAKEVRKAEESLFRDYNDEIFEKDEADIDYNTLNTLEAKIDKQYNDLILSIPEFNPLKNNPKDHHIALNERYYLLESAHEDIKTADEEIALSEFRELYAEYNQLTKSRRQLKKRYRQINLTIHKTKTRFYLNNT